MYSRPPSKHFVLRFAAVCLLVLVHFHPPIRLWAQMATEDRLLYRGWWPRHSVPSKDAYVGPAACAKCHTGEAATEQNTPMGRTASLISNSDVLANHRYLNFQSGQISYQITTTSGKSVYTISDGTHTASSPLVWSFGDGHIGQSFLFEREGTLFESRVSYFGTLKALDFTPGRKLTDARDLEQAMARPVTGSEVVRCFACHATASTINEKFDDTQVIPGITCEACHGPGRHHVAAAESLMKGEAAQMQGTIFDPSTLSPSDAADFCGSCHGTYWDVKLQGLEGKANIRAQTYRLEKSRCWGIKGDTRLTCVACHDPHQPLVRDSSFYDKNCLSCHVATASMKVSADHPGPGCKVSTKNCASCHMPKYDDLVMHYTFTDHDIRIARSGDPYPD